MTTSWRADVIGVVKTAEQLMDEYDAAKTTDAREAARVSVVDRMTEAKCGCSWECVDPELKHPGSTHAHHTCRRTGQHGVHHCECGVAMEKDR